MNDVVGAYCTIVWNGTGDVVDGCYFSFEGYNDETEITPSGVADCDVFYYADSPEQLRGMIVPNRWFKLGLMRWWFGKNPANDFAVLSIDEWVTNA
jgi:hypothetical protein